MTNEEIKEVLKNINNILANIAVSGVDVFNMADCRRALEQVAENIKVETKKADTAKKK